MAIQDVDVSIAIDVYIMSHTVIILSLFMDFVIFIIVFIKFRETGMVPNVIITPERTLWRGLKEAENIFS